MVHRKIIRLTKFELEVMTALWQLGSASVREIHEQLSAGKRAAYTTVQTIIYRLEEKGAVRRTKKIGNAHVFEAMVTREDAHGKLIDELLDLFGGSARPLMAHLVEAGKLTIEDIEEMETALAAMATDKQPKTQKSQAKKSPSAKKR